MMFLRIFPSFLLSIYGLYLIVAACVPFDCVVYLSRGGHSIQALDSRKSRLSAFFTGLFSIVCAIIAGVVLNGSSLTNIGRKPAQQRAEYSAQSSGSTIAAEANLSKQQLDATTAIPAGGTGDSAARLVPSINRADLLDWLDGVPEETKDLCQATTYREPSKSVTPGATQVRLRNLGMWCFFDSTGLIYDVRMEAPFQGSVSGVRIGDTVQSLQERFGDPIKRFSTLPGMPEALLYRLDPVIRVRIQPNQRGQVETIFIFR